MFIDVREPYEIAEVAYDVKNIKNIPLNKIESRLSEIPKNEPVILVCNRGRRSAEARGILKKHGYHTMNMNGGILEWQRKNYQ